MVLILWAILAVVVVVWLIGFVIDIAGNAIHLLLIVALAILIYNLLQGRRIG
ncbi:MAG: lmo0937 family membrane protein [Chloroflexota bacterium]|nr:lmo0937 family membrane protein [Chloroflexota bacterium]